MSAPYGKITLTTIAEKLGWSRANLYKYVTTKEEIFLEISSDKMAAYYSSLLSAFPEGNNFSAPVIAEVWSGILNAHQDCLRYVSYLNPIIETNVTVERLVIFKKKYYDYANAFCHRLSEMLSLPQKKRIQTPAGYSYVCKYERHKLLQKSTLSAGTQTPGNRTSSPGLLRQHERFCSYAD